MNNVSYMQNNNGLITMFCEQLPEKGFVDALKIRNICMVSILTIAQKKESQGGPDVDILQVTGERNRITKQQLMSSYVHCNGRKINVHYLKSGKKYYVYNICAKPEPYKTLKLPDNCKGILGTKDVQSGMYLICKVDENGEMNRETMYAISEKLFKKCFKIPAQSVIKKHMDKKPNKTFGLYNPGRLSEIRGFNRQNSVNNIERGYAQNNSMPHKINIGTGMIGAPSRQSMTTPPRVSLQKESPQTQPQQRPIQQRQMQQGNVQQIPTKRFTVTHRILSMHNNALLGYVVKDIKTNKTQQLSVQQTMTMCERHLIDNIMIVTRENGVKFLKGNNIRIEMLPFILS